MIVEFEDALRIPVPGDRLLLHTGTLYTIQGGYAWGPQLIVKRVIGRELLCTPEERAFLDEMYRAEEARQKEAESIVVEVPALPEAPLYKWLTE